jgi:hypothetical protein
LEGVQRPFIQFNPSKPSGPKCVEEPKNDAVEFARGLGFEPDEKQREVLLSTAKRGILNCTRQWGKTTVSAAKAVHRAYTEAGSTIIVASPGARQSAEWMRTAAGMLRNLEIDPQTDGSNRISLALPNGSRIVGLPEMEAKVRGFSAVSMIVIDEASRVSDAMYHALLPMLSVSNGDLWMMSTPFGKRGFFYEMWQHGAEKWHRVQVKATDCPRISAEFLEEQRGDMGREMFLQEHMCEFLGSGVNAFDRDLVEKALDDEVDAWPDSVLHVQDPMPWLRMPKRDQAFYVGVDLGKKQDHSTYAIVESCDGMLLVRVAARIPLGTPYTQVVETVRDVVRSPKLRGKCTVVVDGSGVGEPVVEMMRRADLGCALMAVIITGGSGTRSGAAGYRYVSKFDLMTGLQLALEKEELKIARRMPEAAALVKELVDVRVAANGAMGAEGRGQHDDLVMAVALACWRAKKGWNDRGGGGFL